MLSRHVKPELFLRLLSCVSCNCFSVFGSFASVRQRSMDWTYIWIQYCCWMMDYSEPGVTEEHTDLCKQNLFFSVFDLKSSLIVWVQTPCRVLRYYYSTSSYFHLCSQEARDMIRSAFRGPCKVSVNKGRFRLFLVRKVFKEHKPLLRYKEYH